MAVAAAEGARRLRKRAINTGPWRDNGDGYIEKGPFPAAKTSVKAVTRLRRRRRRQSDDRPDAHQRRRQAAGPLLADRGRFDRRRRRSRLTFESDATVLWFLAVDPTGAHETGPPVKWTNTLTLTYDPKEVMGKRTVALTVKPRGEIRWNLDGTNVKEGKLYAGPIDVPGETEATLYVYAEDQGVSATKNFTIRPVTGGKATIDPAKPATSARRRSSPPPRTPSS